MTLRELINSVDSQQYSDSALYQKLCETKPEYGSNRHIQVKLVNGEVAITNVHVVLWVTSLLIPSTLNQT